jgi:hypothetical protein
VYDKSVKPNVTRKHVLLPEERQWVHDESYARGLDLFEAAPYDVGLLEPKSTHGKMEKWRGKYDVRVYPNLLPAEYSDSLQKIHVSYITLY